MSLLIKNADTVEKLHTLLGDPYLVIDAPNVNPAQKNVSVGTIDEDKKFIRVYDIKENPADNKIIQWKLKDDWRCTTCKYTKKGLKFHSNKPTLDVYYCVTLCFIKEGDIYRLAEINKVIAEVKEVENVIHYSLPDLKVYNVGDHCHWRFRDYESKSIKPSGFSSVLEAVLHYTSYTQSLLDTKSEVLLAA